MLKIKIATMIFFENVKILESIPFTPNALKNIERPEIIAVARTNFIPLFMFFSMKKFIYIICYLNL